MPLENRAAHTYQLLEPCAHPATDRGRWPGHHAPATGLVAAELIVDGRISSIDADEVGLARFSKPSEPAERTGF